jgi:hypothetical protein
MIERVIMLELRQQATIKARLAAAELRKGLHVPSIIPVSMEMLMDIKRQIEERLESKSEERRFNPNLN